MNKVILTILTLLLFLSCTDNPMPYRFIYLEKLSGHMGYPEYIIERILIEYPPKSHHLVDSIMQNYRKTKCINLCTVDSTMYKYLIAFYKKTNRTSYFITNKEDEYHMIGESKPGSGYAEESLGLFCYYRSKDNPKIWYSTYPEKFKDTIYCK